MTTRGLRDNNPGNLEDAGIHWDGISGRDGVYLRFITPFFGIRALARDLHSKWMIDHLRCVADIIERYAPPNENNTTAYIAAVAREMCCSATHLLNLDDPETLVTLVTAVIRHECGSVPYDRHLIGDAVDAAIPPRIVKG